MIEKELTIKNKLGLHLRPASLLVKEAEKYDSEISIVKGTTEVNAKSILGIMTLMAKKGTVLKVVVNGEDEAEAMEGLEKLFASKFAED